jgi:predicted RNA methylase
MTEFLTNPEPEVHVKGDELGRSYTPDNVAFAIVHRLVQDQRRLERVLEPCIGGGAFVRAVRQHEPTAKVTGVDVHATAPGFALANERAVLDFSKGGAYLSVCAPGDARFDLAITNPPFGRAVGQEVTMGIVANARECARVVVMLMPLAYLGQVGWDPFTRACWEVWPIVGRVWEHEREMAVYLWRRDRGGLGSSMVELRSLAV